MNSSKPQSLLREVFLSPLQLNNSHDIDKRQNRYAASRFEIDISDGHPPSFCHNPYSQAFIKCFLSFMLSFQFHYQIYYNSTTLTMIEQLYVKSILWIPLPNQLPTKSRSSAGFVVVEAIKGSTIAAIINLLMRGHYCNNMMVMHFTTANYVVKNSSTLLSQALMNYYIYAC